MQVKVFFTSTSIFWAVDLSDGLRVEIDISCKLLYYCHRFRDTRLVGFRHHLQ